MNFPLSLTDLPVRLRFEQPMTDNELLQFCARNDLMRIERDSNGELIVMSPAGGRTGHRNTQLIVQLARWADGDGTGLVFDSNTGFTLKDGSMRSPDAAWIAWPRWNGLTPDEQESFSPICPEFIIELRSQSDRLAELQAKMLMWIANGAELAWLIDPDRRIVEIYRPGRDVEVIEGGSAVEADGPVAGFVLELDRLWR